MNSAEGRRLPWDWYPGTIPDNVEIGDGAYIETAHSFLRYRSQRAIGASFGDHSSLYKTTMLDVGPAGSVILGKYTLVQGARILCDSEIQIGDYSMISWKVLLMDSYRWPTHPGERRGILHRITADQSRATLPSGEARPITIGRNVWVGFDSCILPGVTVGEGSIVGARSVVTTDVEPFTIVAGNPARAIRTVNAAGDLRDRELMQFGR